MNAHREINTHTTIHTLLQQNIRAYSYIFTRVFKHRHTQRPHPTQMHTHTSVYYISTYTDTTHTHTHTSRHGHHENMHMTWTAAPANGSSYHWQPSGKQYLILENAPVRETLSQPKILHGSVSVSTWQNRKGKNSMWARPLNSAVWKEQMWRDHTIPNYQWMKKLGFQRADGRPEASMNVPEFIRVLQ